VVELGLSCEFGISHIHLNLFLDVVPAAHPSSEVSPMWNKLSGAFGRSCSSIEQDNVKSTRIDMMSSVYEQYPNLSVFHMEDELTPLPSSPANPPQSISRKSKTLFRCTSNAENERPSSPFGPSGFPKKVKSTLQLKTSRECPPIIIASQHSPGTFQLPKLCLPGWAALYASSCRRERRTVQLSAIYLA